MTTNKALIQILLISTSLTSSLGNAKTQNHWPELCDEQQILEKVKIQAQKDFGICLIKGSKTANFGRPESTFKQWVSVILDCKTVGMVEFTATNEVNVKAQSCSLKNIKQTKLSGSYCGLTDSRDDSWIEDESKFLELSRLSDAELLALPEIIHQQIIIYAKTQDPMANTLLDSVNLLKEGSESEDLYYIHLKVNGSLYNEVKSYPGGNPVSLIFQDNTTQVVADNSDDSISCKLK